MDLSKVAGEITKILVTEEQITSKVKELALEVDKRYVDKDVLLVGVLKGAVMFMADLSREIQIPVQMDWMAVSSYGSGTQSSARSTCCPAAGEGFEQATRGRPASAARRDRRCIGPGLDQDAPKVQ